MYSKSWKCPLKSKIGLPREENAPGASLTYDITESLLVSLSGLTPKTWGFVLMSKNETPFFFIRPTLNERKPPWERVFVWSFSAYPIESLTNSFLTLILILHLFSYLKNWIYFPPRPSLKDKGCNSLFASITKSTAFHTLALQCRSVDLWCLLGKGQKLQNGNLEKKRYN